MKKIAIPDEIALGHELVHAYRATIGIRKNKDYASTYYTNNNGKSIRVDDVSVEELETVGLPYKNSDTSNYLYSSSIRYTENALRREHGYGRRVKY